MITNTHLCLILELISSAYQFMSKVIFLDRELQVAPEGNTAMVTLVGPDTLCVARVVGGKKLPVAAVPQMNRI